MWQSHLTRPECRCPRAAVAPCRRHTMVHCRANTLNLKKAVGADESGFQPLFSTELAIFRFHHVGEMRFRLGCPVHVLPCCVNMRPRAGATVMYLRARGRRVGCAQRSKLRFALRARENEEVDIEFLRISCACIRSLTGAQASSRNSGRCTSFSLNLHTSLMRHPSRLPRPTVVEALRMM